MIEFITELNIITKIGLFLAFILGIYTYYKKRKINDLRRNQQGYQLSSSSLGVYGGGDRAYNRDTMTPNFSKQGSYGRTGSLSSSYIYNNKLNDSQRQNNPIKNDYNAGIATGLGSTSGIGAGSSILSTSGAGTGSSTGVALEQGKFGTVATGTKEFNPQPNQTKYDNTLTNQILSHPMILSYNQPSKTQDQVNVNNLNKGQVLGNGPISTTNTLYRTKSNERDSILQAKPKEDKDSIIPEKTISKQILEKQIIEIDEEQIDEEKKGVVTVSSKKVISQKKEEKSQIGEKNVKDVINYKLTIQEVKLKKDQVDGKKSKQQSQLPISETRKLLKSNTTLAIQPNKNINEQRGQIKGLRRGFSEEREEDLIIDNKKNDNNTSIQGNLSKRRPLIDLAHLAEYSYSLNMSRYIPKQTIMSQINKSFEEATPKSVTSITKPDISSTKTANMSNKSAETSILTGGIIQNKKPEPSTTAAATLMNTTQAPQISKTDSSLSQSKPLLSTLQQAPMSNNLLTGGTSISSGGGLLGQRTVVSDKKDDKEESKEKPVVNNAPVQDKPSILNSKPSLLDNKQGLFDNKQGLFDNKQGLSDNKPSLLDNKPGLFTNKPSLLDSKPNLLDNKPSLLDTKPSLPDSKPSLFDSSKSLGTNLGSGLLQSGASNSNNSGISGSSSLLQSSGSSGLFSNKPQTIDAPEKKLGIFANSNPLIQPKQDTNTKPLDQTIIQPKEAENVPKPSLIGGYSLLSNASAAANSSLLTKNDSDVQAQANTGRGLLFKQDTKDEDKPKETKTNLLGIINNSGGISGGSGLFGSELSKNESNPLGNMLFANKKPDLGPNTDEKKEEMKAIIGAGANASANTSTDNQTTKPAQSLLASFNNAGSSLTGNNTTSSSGSGSGVGGSSGLLGLLSQSQGNQAQPQGNILSMKLGILKSDSLANKESNGILPKQDTTQDTNIQGQVLKPNIPSLTTTTESKPSLFGIPNGGLAPGKSGLFSGNNTGLLSGMNSGLGGGTSSLQNTGGSSGLLGQLSKNTNPTDSSTTDQKPSGLLSNILQKPANSLTDTENKPQQSSNLSNGLGLFGNNTLIGSGGNANVGGSKLFGNLSGNSLQSQSSLLKQDGNTTGLFANLANSGSTPGAIGAGAGIGGGLIGSGGGGSSLFAGLSQKQT